jgi:ATP-dependent DNA ligase
VFAKACELGLEGIVSKRAGSLYRSGRSKQRTRISSGRDARGLRRPCAD